MKLHSALAVALVFSACGDDSSPGPVNADASVDTRATPDGPSTSGKFACDTPGAPCNAHDPCAINPVCSADGWCVAARVQDCDDGLECTVDACEGLGKCSHAIKDDWCALPVAAGSGSELQCFSVDTRHPDGSCQGCAPSVDQNAWSPVNGGTCDDGDACTSDDYCNVGTCVGGQDHSSECDDELACTEDRCDGKGGCEAKTVLSGWCLIDGECQQDKAEGANGCTLCDTSKSTTAWSLAADYCLINDVCFQAGEQALTSCATCDPATSTSAWTPTPNTCLIGGSCYKAGDKDPSWCNTCDPTKSSSDWTPLPGYCQIDGICYQDGEKNLGACGVCKTATSTTKWTLGIGECLIGGACYSAGDPDSSGCRVCDPATEPGDLNAGGCAECDPTTSTSAFTVKGTSCLIGDVCHAAGDLHPAGCGACAPATNKYGWSVSGLQCLIGEACVLPGTKDAVGCGECDPTKTKTSWTKIPGCSVLVLAALDKTYAGDFGGPDKADALCAAEAVQAGYPGTFKSLLADASRNLRSVLANLAGSTIHRVVNTKGEELFADWTKLFAQKNPAECGAGTSTSCPWGGADIYRFDGSTTSGDAWHGSDPTGLSSTDNCNNWSSKSASVKGARYYQYTPTMFSSSSYSATRACSYATGILCVGAIQ